MTSAVEPTIGDWLPDLRDEHELDMLLQQDFPSWGDDSLSLMMGETAVEPAQKTSHNVKVPQSAHEGPASTALYTDTFNDSDASATDNAGATSLAAGASVSDLQPLAPDLMSDDMSDFELPADMAWLHEDTPFFADDAMATRTSTPAAPSCSGTNVSSRRTSDSAVGCAADLLLHPSTTAVSQHTISSTHSDGVSFEQASRARSATGALRPSKRATVAGTPGAQMPVMRPAAKGMQGQATGQYVVRMMPVWMMPSAQHPQGRMMMMPVHFMPPTMASCPQAPAPGMIDSSKTKGDSSRKRRAGGPSSGSPVAKKAMMAPVAMAPTMAAAPMPMAMPGQNVQYMMAPMRPMAARRTGGGSTLPPFAATPPKAGSKP